MPPGETWETAAASAKAARVIATERVREYARALRSASKLRRPDDSSDVLSQHLGDTTSIIGTLQLHADDTYDAYGW